MLAPQFIESALRSVYTSDKLSDLKLDPYAKIDAAVQDVLDEYWPGTTGLKSIKRAGDKQVYKAMNGDLKVLVKSVGYDASVEVYTKQTMDFVDYMSDEISIAYFLTPGVEVSDDISKIVTVSWFVPGVTGNEFGPIPGGSWILDEAAVKANGAYWGQYRHRSIKYAVEHPQEYEAYPLWNEVSGGVFAVIPQPDIPMTPENWGIVHGDAHPDNWKIETLGTDQYNYSAIDFDTSNKNFYLIDVGTIVWYANYALYYGGENSQPVADYQTHIDNFKSWFLEGYGWTVDPAELTACCARRRDFMAVYYYYQVQSTPPFTDAHKYAAGWLEQYYAGTIPSC